MNLRDIRITESGIKDVSQVIEVEKQAFGYDKEAELTAELLKDKTAKPIISLLAYYNQTPVGHILFTRAYINSMSQQPLFHILAPLAVIPEYQKQGVGGLLIEEGHKRLKEIGSKMVLVLGHIDYYPSLRFHT